jgi:NADH:ubiquinone oxidoreductase subunit 4 (subunit M)
MFVSEFYILSSVISSPLMAGVFVFNLLLSGAYYVNIARLLEIGKTEKKLRLGKVEAAVLIALTIIIILTGLQPSIVLSKI